MYYNDNDNNIDYNNINTPSLDCDGINVILPKEVEVIYKGKHHNFEWLPIADNIESWNEAFNTLKNNVLEHFDIVATSMFAFITFDKKFTLINGNDFQTNKYLIDTIEVFGCHDKVFYYILFLYIYY